MNTTKPIFSNEGKVPVTVFQSEAAGNKVAAQRIAKVIRERNAQGKYAVLGLATGASPIGTYNELVRLHKEEGLSFKKVIIYNMDEYFGLDINTPQSCVAFMHQYLFDHVDIEPDNYHVPSGLVEEKDRQQYCEDYEKAIEAAGGFDFHILGIGTNGHIGFNEPGSKIDSKTRIIKITDKTKQAHAAEFGGAQFVPDYGITIGVSTILKARKILLLAWGDSKADAIQKAVEVDKNEDTPASLLQGHPNVEFFLDPQSAAKISFIK